MSGINIGLARLEIGKVSPTGMGTELKQLGLTLVDSCKYNPEEGDTQDFYVEEQDVPFESTTIEGSDTFTATLADPTLETLVEVWGGEVDELTGEYKRPRVVVPKEVCLKITPRKGMGFNVYKTTMSAVFTSDIGKNNLLGLNLTFRISLLEDTSFGKWSNFEVK